jgi:putative endopeptidase
MQRILGTTLALALVLAAAGCDGASYVDVEFTTNERGLDRRNMDETVNPCDDFYQYANGNWFERNPIPAEYSVWSVSNEMRERNNLLLREILEDAAGSGAPQGTNKQKVGDFWTSGMDTEAIDQAGAAPLAADMQRIAAAESLSDLQAIIHDLHVEGIAVLYDFGIDQDLKNSDQYILYATQGGLGLPERDYYIRDDEESVELREKYVAHVSAMLQLLGDSPEDAVAAAETNLALETRLAHASLTRVELRDPANYYNIETVLAADEATPNFSWSRFLTTLGLDEMETFSYAHPVFFAEMNAVLSEVPLDDWKNYVRFHLVSQLASYLSDDFVNEDFAFFGQTLQGTEELRPRWKRVISQTSRSMGEALGQVYVERAFPPKTKQRADEMIENLRATVQTRLQALAWMGDETKARALEKLDAFNSKIGYPDEWRDYSTLDVNAESYVANVRAGNVFEVRRNLDKIGEPIDRNEWGMPPQMINAYYNPLLNEIVFPAAIMQPPFFDGEIDDAVNYGGMGSVIGHEFMHGFDDQGSKFAANGNMDNWWTDEDRQRFEERTQKLVDQFNGFVAVDDLHVNGELTLGENIGDLAGLTMAYHALQRALEQNHPGEIDGFTPEQRFFLAWAQAWRRNYRDEALKLQVNTDPHSPGKFRTIGPLSNMPEFAAAFGCQEGDPMVQVAELTAEIW